MSKKKETASTIDLSTGIYRAYETTELLGINPAAEQARQLRIIELLERIEAALRQGKGPENK